MFPPMTPLTERVRIEFANRQLEQAAQVEQPVSPPLARPFALLRRLFGSRKKPDYTLTLSGAARRFYPDRLV